MLSAGQREVLQGFSPHKDLDTEFFVDLMEPVDLGGQQVGGVPLPALRANAENADLVMTDRHVVESDELM